MNAVQILGPQTSPSISLTAAVRIPEANASQILVKVHAAGITADELLWPELYKTQSRIPGHEVSGTVFKLGPSYDGKLQVGDEVFVMLHANRGQGQAEYVATEQEELCRMPKRLSFAAAAALPIPLVTAWEAIHDKLKLQRGQRVLVTGASGAVGSIFVHLAAEVVGAEVVALGSREHCERLRELGAIKVVYYDDQEWETHVMGVDAVFDTVGGDVLRRTWSTVKPDGAIVTIGDPPPPWAFGRESPEALQRRPNVRYDYFVVSPNRSYLSEAVKLLDNGVLEPLEVEVFPFNKAIEAWTFARRRGRGRKAVLQFISDEVMESSKPKMSIRATDQSL